MLLLARYARSAAIIAELYFWIAEGKNLSNDKVFELKVQLK